MALTQEIESGAAEFLGGLRALRSRQGWIWWGQALTLAAFWRLAALLPPDRASALGGCLLRSLAPRLRRTDYITRNLKVAFPEKDEVQIQGLAREIWCTFGKLLGEYPHLRSIVGRDLDKRVEVVIKTDLETPRRNGKPIVFVTGHLANWELSTSTAVAMGFDLTVIYSPLRNPIVDRMLQRHRKSLGCGFVAKNASVRMLMKELAAGRSIGLLVDQRVEGGEKLPFFGRPGLTTVSPARLAIRFDCDVVPVRVERLEGARFRVTYCEALRAADYAGSAQERAVAMTCEINRVLESWIRERPQQWICWKRRWPKRPQPGLAH